MKYAVVDLEMCKVPKGYRKFGFNWSKETIQIGAVLLDEKYEMIDKFNSYVCPQYGKIDKYIENLTGISQSQVLGAPKFKDALDAFIEWLPYEDVRCVSWSESDLYQLIHETMEKTCNDERLEIIFANWIDCQKTFSKKMGKENVYKLEEALIASDIITEGREHDGFSDAINTAFLFSKLETDPDFKLNEEYEAAREEKTEHLSFSMGDMFSGIVLA